MKPVRAKSVLIRRKYLDPWFLSRSGMNLYRGCVHNCIYCDGRHEHYRVEGDFSGDAVYKENAVDVLARELDPRRRRKHFSPGNVFIGGGVSDSWQPAEEKLALTRRVLELFKVFPNPLLLLTKSILILRDFDLLTALNAECRVTVGVSLSTMDGKIASKLEPGASTPAERIEIIRRGKEVGLGVGVMLLPVIPMITDRSEQINAVYSAAKQAGADFVLAGSMTLKKGRQRDYFMKAAREYFPEEVGAYGQIYGTDYNEWGNPSRKYLEYFGRLIHEISLDYGLPRRIPPWLFPENLSPAERVSLMLNQMDGLLHERGLVSEFGRVARSILKLDVPLETVEGREKLRGLLEGAGAERIIKDILHTGSTPVYERILTGR